MSERLAEVIPITRALPRVECRVCGWVGPTVSILRPVPHLRNDDRELAVWCEGGDLW